MLESITLIQYLGKSAYSIPQSKVYTTLRTYRVLFLLKGTNMKLCSVSTRLCAEMRAVRLNQNKKITATLKDDKKSLWSRRSRR